MQSDRGHVPPPPPPPAARNGHRKQSVLRGTQDHSTGSHSELSSEEQGRSDERHLHHAYRSPPKKTPKLRKHSPEVWGESRPSTPQNGPSRIPSQPKRSSFRAEGRTPSTSPLMRMHSDSLPSPTLPEAERLVLDDPEFSKAVPSRHSTVLGSQRQHSRSGSVQVPQAPPPGPGTPTSHAVREGCGPVVPSSIQAAPNPAAVQPFSHQASNYPPSLQAPVHSPLGSQKRAPIALPRRYTYTASPDAQTLNSQRASPTPEKEGTFSTSTSHADPDRLGVLNHIKLSLSRGKNNLPAQQAVEASKIEPVPTLDPESADYPTRSRGLNRPERAKPRTGPTGRQHFVKDMPVPYDAQPGGMAGAQTGSMRVRPIPRFDHTLDRKYSTMQSLKSQYTQSLSACRQVWLWFAYAVTFYAIPPFFRWCGKRDKAVQIAWREKMALVTIIGALMVALAFLTFLMQNLICGIPPVRVKASRMGGGNIAINGVAYDVSRYEHPPAAPFGTINLQEVYSSDFFIEKDLSFMFQTPSKDCDIIWGEDNATLFPCTIGAKPEAEAREISGNRSYCHRRSPDLEIGRTRREVYYDWDEIVNIRRQLTVFNSRVLDLERLNLLNTDRREKLLNSKEVDIQQVIAAVRNRDSSLMFHSNSTMRKVGNCIASITSVGSIDVRPLGCIAVDIVTYVSLIVIVGVVLVKFIMALVYGLIIAPRLSRKLSEHERESMRAQRDRWEHMSMKAALERQIEAQNAKQQLVNWGDGQRFSGPAVLGDYCKTSSLYSPSWKARRHQSIVPFGKEALAAFANAESQSGGSSCSRSGDFDPLSNPANKEGMFLQDDIMYIMILVTCYSEGAEGIRTTLDSVARSQYSDDRKVIFVVADGLIKGEGNEKTTPEIIIEMMQVSSHWRETPRAYSYVAIADGEKRHNMARVYAGHYVTATHRTPMILVVKCGTPKEQSSRKPGNRGKRDSQLILMSFLQKVMFDDRMTPLEFDIFQKITYVMCGVTPDKFEVVVMVDADTKVKEDAFPKIVSCLARDPSIMGLCGETAIDNRWASWWSMIQVFEYYISHHLQKSFESVFGGVTCLPGCFCTYRIKAPKGTGYWVPILANPDIVEEYSENVVDTLHKKNLLLLGEDRYLTTLMLQNFPKRKNVFLPGAGCKTTVPDTFSVLLSQRRRWINSTLHNLVELVLVRELCGIFCISMQFLIFVELVGMVLLPAAISFTIYLIVQSFLLPEPPLIPLLLLAAILGLPAVVTLVTIRRLHYALWMLMYFSGLLVWNFVLPLYAFWHFDDFSWGETRRVEGDSDKVRHEERGGFDSSQIVMKRWQEWHREKSEQQAVAARDESNPAAHHGFLH